jgi:hypothetical protein
MPDLDCPFRESRTNFTEKWSHPVTVGATRRGWSGQQMMALQCDNSQCQLIIGGILARDGLIHDYWPRSYSGKVFPDVPEHIGAAASEAYLARSAGAPRAAIAMARAVVEATAKDHGIVKGDLMDKIDALAKAGEISEHMREAAHEIRFAGNEIAHGDLAEQAIVTDDADEILGLMDAILLRVYQEPAQVEHVRERRKSRLGAEYVHARPATLSRPSPHQQQGQTFSVVAWRRGKEPT